MLVVNCIGQLLIIDYENGLNKVISLASIKLNLKENILEFTIIMFTLLLVSRSNLPLTENFMLLFLISKKHLVISTEISNGLYC